jgi:hypothetical protein
MGEPYDWLLEQVENERAMFDEECRPLFSYQARAFELFASHDRSPLSNETANVTATPNRTIDNTYAMQVLAAEWGRTSTQSRRDTEADAELAQVRVRLGTAA